MNTLYLNLIVRYTAVILTGLAVAKHLGALSGVAAAFLVLAYMPQKKI